MLLVLKLTTKVMNIDVVHVNASGILTVCHMLQPQLSFD